MQKSSTITSSPRLASLDLLRGADIFFLTVLAPLLEAFHRVRPLPEAVMTQLRHPSWVGFSFLDLVMPLFIFMCGAALPLALPKRLDPDGKARGRYWRHILGRVVLLWFFGLIAQGELFSFDLQRISFFNNTLQTIACGYLITALVLRFKSPSVHLASAFLLTLLYGIFLHTCGDLTPEGNAAVVYEVKFLSLFYPDPSWHPVHQIAAWHYTWWTTIPMFGVMALAGACTTNLLRSTLMPWRKVGLTCLAGLSLLFLGGLVSLVDPVIKHIFTPSFTSLALGLCVLLYAIFYALFDVLGFTRGMAVISLFGRHSLLAYMLTKTPLRTFLGSIVGTIFYGLSRTPGDGLSRFFTQPLSVLIATTLSAILLYILLIYIDFIRTQTKNRSLTLF